ncbi:hemerythrin HHE cation binding domain-containing protein [Cladophialophora carrionii]|uniref:Hemerythrin HHE cation binding domain-containing protein n=1 Tax=Cladophialophora carrionii TaxID=86049 RepID=A0A1C1CJK6_9EURO|nr:hemerythrin HHE cation binding domain-containing protein [Cladophialophora carrionii]
MQAVPIIREPVPGKSTSTRLSRPKSPSQTRYSHLLYLSEAERQQYASRMEKASESSLRSSNSVRSNRSAASSVSSVSTGHTSKLSMRSPRYVDDHYPLITTIHPESVPASVPKDHPALWCARQMAQIHNTITRALNASWNHAVSVQPDTQEASDFLLFNQQLFKTLDHHHHVEDDYMFPALEKLLGRPGAMETNTKGHESFADGLAVFQKYVFVTKPAEFNGVTFRHIIESFAPDLIQHLHDEIPTLVSLHVLDAKEVMKVWKHAEHLATKDNSLYTDAPWTLGCQDKSFLIDGQKCDFPDVPWLAEAMIRNWHGKKHAGAWSFCPSDLSGKRRLMPIA